MVIVAIIFMGIIFFLIGFACGIHKILNDNDKIDGNLVINQEDSELYLQVASTAYDDFKKKQIVTFKVIRK